MQTVLYPILTSGAIVAFLSNSISPGSVIQFHEGRCVNICYVDTYKALHLVHWSVVQMLGAVTNADRYQFHYT